MKYTEGGQKVESPEEIAARLGVSVEFGQEHQGDHICVDRRRYVKSCLVSDPDVDHVARSYMRIYGIRFRDASLIDSETHDCTRWARLRPSGWRCRECGEYLATEGA